MDLLTRLRNHLLMMAPHQKDRHTGKLLVEVANRFTELEDVVTTDHETKADFVARVHAILHR